LSEAFPIPINIYEINVRDAFRIDSRSALAVAFINLGYNENLNYAKLFPSNFAVPKII
jgi:hypothetical protein